MMPVRETWLKMTSEDILEPEMPICDPHHHLWHYPQGNQVLPTSRYLLEELLQDTGSGHRIMQTVFVQCGAMYKKSGPPELRPVGETEFVQGVAAQSASGLYGKTRVAAGIVGYANLTMGAAVATVLEAQLSAGRDRFRGIRHASAWDESPAIMKMGNTPKGLLGDAKFREGFACLKRYGLSYDAWLYHPQIPELADLAAAFPDTMIILDHIGTPIGTGPYAGKRDEIFGGWKKAMAKLSSCQNVFIKVGGLGMAVCGFGWHERGTPPDSTELAKAMEPYYLACIELFGTSRCMFESNFPVDKASYSYSVMWNAFKRMTKGFTAAERSELFHDTAVRAYRLTTDYEG